jgi:hypothetical protein
MTAEELIATCRQNRTGKTKGEVAFSQKALSLRDRFFFRVSRSRNGLRLAVGYKSCHQQGTFARSPPSNRLDRPASREGDITWGGLGIHH